MLHTGKPHQAFWREPERNVSPVPETDRGQDTDSTRQISERDSAAHCFSFLWRDGG